MRTLSRPSRSRHGPATACAICTLLATLFPLITASAADQGNAGGSAADNAQSLGSPFQTIDPSNAPPRWTFSAEAIVLDRIGGVNRTLVARVPGSVPFITTSIAPDAEAFNSNQFHPGFSAGPRISLVYRGDSGFGAELSYFNIFDQGATKAIGPDTPPDWLVMKAPGSFWQTQDFPYQAMVWSDTTSLYSAEASARWKLSSRMTLLAGFRWLQLNDNLQGTLAPADLTAPTWKGNLLTNIFQITPGGAAGNYPPFWTTSTRNNLYGVQVGMVGSILELGHVSLVGTAKLGLFDNHAGQSTGVSIAKVIYPSSATTNHIAFVSEVGLQLKYRILDGMTLTVGYEALWLNGVALAAGQIEETVSARSNVQALGVRTGSNVLFHGATAGMEYTF